MGNGLMEMKQVVREGAGAMKAVKKRQMKQSDYARELGLEDPYKKKKKKKKESDGGGTIRSFMDKFIKAKEDRMNQE